MDREGFLRLSSAEQHDWLQAKTDSGASVDAVVGDLGISRRELQTLGHIYAAGKWVQMFIKSGSGMDFDPAKDVAAGGSAVSFFAHEPNPDKKQ